MFALAVPEAYEGVGPLPRRTGRRLRGAGPARGAGSAGGDGRRGGLLLRDWATTGRRRNAASPGLVTGKASPRCARARSVRAGRGRGRRVFTVVDGRTAPGGRGHGPVRASAGPGPPACPPGRREVLAAGPARHGAGGGGRTWARLRRPPRRSGVGQALLERTVAYVEAAHPVRGAVGSFQAVKHRLADTLIALEFARPAAVRGGAALADWRPGRRGAPRRSRRARPRTPRPGRRCSCTARSATRTS